MNLSSTMAWVVASSGSPPSTRPGSTFLNTVPAVPLGFVIAQRASISLSTSTSPFSSNSIVLIRIANGVAKSDPEPIPSSSKATSPITPSSTLSTLPLKNLNPAISNESSEGRPFSSGLFESASSMAPWAVRHSSCFMRSTFCAAPSILCMAFKTLCALRPNAPIPASPSYLLPLSAVPSKPAIVALPIMSKSTEPLILNSLLEMVMPRLVNPIPLSP